MKIKPLFLALAFLTCSTLGTQELLHPIFSFSQKKDSYITIKDGTEFVGRITGLKRKKGLIQEIKYKGEDGKKVKISPDDIKFMYVQATAVDNFGSAVDKITDTQRWGEEEVEDELIKEGYSYFENVEVLVKKKKRTLLMQLLNLHFSSKVKIYHDPFAKETTSLGVGGLTVAGGDEKSYLCSVWRRYRFQIGEKALSQEL